MCLPCWRNPARFSTSTMESSLIWRESMRGVFQNLQTAPQTPERVQQPVFWCVYLSFGHRLRPIHDPIRKPEGIFRWPHTCRTVLAHDRRGCWNQLLQEACTDTRCAVGHGKSVLCCLGWTDGGFYSGLPFQVSTAFDLGPWHFSAFSGCLMVLLLVFSVSLRLFQPNFMWEVLVT